MLREPAFEDRVVLGYGNELPTLASMRVEVSLERWTRNLAEAAGQVLPLLFGRVVAIFACGSLFKHRGSFVSETHEAGV